MRLEVVAEFGREPDANVVFLVAFAQLGRHHALDHAAQLHGDAADVEPEIGGQIAIDARDHFGLAAFERAVDVDRAGHLADLGDDLVAEPLQRDHVVAADVDADRRLRRRALHELRIGDDGLDQRHRRDALTRVGLERDQARARVRASASSGRAGWPSADRR